MATLWNNPQPAPPVATQAAVGVVAGEGWAYFDLGLACSTGSPGQGCDLVEAHKWFNLAALCGYDEAAQCRAELANDMTQREIAEAQRRARAWIANKGG